MRDELGRVLCPHGRIMACAECGDDYERELQGPVGGARGDATIQSPQSTDARAFVQELATLSMTAQSDRRASAQVYRSALIDVCNRALKWLDALPPPQEPPAGYEIALRVFMRWKQQLPASGFTTHGQGLLFREMLRDEFALAALAAVPPPTQEKP